MNWEALDDPALVVPRVLDVHGTFLRLGFSFFMSKGVPFYRYFVPLFEGGVKAQFSNRNISHVSISVVPNKEQEHADIQIKYGYPVRYRKKDKIILDFKILTSTGTTFAIHVSLYPDEELRRTEKVLQALIENLKTKQVRLTKEVDSEEGIIQQEVLPCEALVSAVESAFSDFATNIWTTNDKDKNWWFDYDCDPKTEDKRLSQPDKFLPTRLPNLDRRRDIFRHIRRPV